MTNQIYYQHASQVYFHRKYIFFIGDIVFCAFHSCVCVTPNIGSDLEDDTTDLLDGLFSHSNVPCRKGVFSLQSDIDSSY